MLAKTEWGKIQLEWLEQRHLKITSESLNGGDKYFWKRKGRFLYTVVEMKISEAIIKTMWMFFKKLKILLPCDPTALPLSMFIYPKGA